MKLSKILLRKHLLLLLVCVLIYSSNSAQKSTKAIFSKHPRNISGEKLVLKRDVDQQSAVVVISGRDCKECVHYVIDLAKIKQRKIYFVYILEQEISAAQKRDVLNSLIEQGYIETDFTTYFIVKSKLKYSSSKSPEILRRESKGRLFEIITYNQIWEAMSGGPELCL